MTNFTKDDLAIWEWIDSHPATFSAIVAEESLTGVTSVEHLTVKVRERILVLTQSK